MASQEAPCGATVTVADKPSKVGTAEALGSAVAAHMDSCSSPKCKPSDEDRALVAKLFKR